MATKTETSLTNLVINYLSESDYNSEVSAGTINENEIYMTPMSSSSDYTHPTYTARNSGLYKITVDGIGHVSNVSTVTKSDITALGIPAQDTVYSLPTASSSTLGGVKTTSDVSSTSGLTACPIISGVPYYKDTNTTYSTATTSANGLMSSSDKSKLDGIATGATKVVVDSALSTSSTNAIQNKIVTTELNGKQSTITGAATTITSSNLTTNRALVSDSNGKVAISSVTSTELGYLSGVTSSIQKQLDKHHHQNLHHPDFTAHSIITIGHDSNGYWFRPTDVSATGGVNAGSSSNPFNIVAANILRTYDTDTTSNGVYARVYNNRIYRHSSSSRRYKENIKPIEAEEIAPEKLYDAEVVQFTYKDGYLIDEDTRNGKLISGFIVEDLEKVYPIAIDYNDNGEPEMWNVNIIVPSMLKLIQDQKKKIDELEARIEALEA